MGYCKTAQEFAYGSEDEAGCSTRFTSNTHRSSGVRESLEITARTNWVTDPVRSHSWRVYQYMPHIPDGRFLLFTCLRILYHRLRFCLAQLQPLTCRDSSPVQGPV